MTSCGTWFTWPKIPGNSGSNSLRLIMWYINSSRELDRSPRGDKTRPKVRISPDFGPRLCIALFVLIDIKGLV